jgi:putative polyketide hydroxylase
MRRTPCPPYLGLGVNTAIQSAQNLAWKLAAVLKGQASPSLLATYQVERHPVGKLVAEQSLTGPAAVLFEKEMRGRSDLHLKEPLPILYPIIGYRYRSEAIITQDSAPALRDEIELLEPLELSGLPGSRVPHVWLEQRGQRISTLDLLDGRFVLFCGLAGSDWSEAAGKTALALRIPLANYRIGPTGDLLDLENSFQAKMGIAPLGAVLVRPDGFLAWRSQTEAEQPAQLLERVLTRVMCQGSRRSDLIGAVA